MRALRPTLIYLVLAGLWVALSDLALSKLSASLGVFEHLSTVKGLLFVMVTGLILFCALRIKERRRLNAVKTLRSHVSNLRQAAAVFDATQEGVLVTDAQMRITHLNPAFTRITGYTLEEIIGRSPQLLKSGRHDRAFYQRMWYELANQGSWSGEIWNRRKNGEIYPQWQCIRAIHDENGVISHYVAVFSDITVLKASQKELDHLAHHDPLSNLPNRLLFSERVARAIDASRREQPSGAVLLIDLDHFKHVNESLGHNAGDELLKSASERLQTLLHPDMTLARLGGDEFGLLWEHCPQPEQAANLAEQLLTALREPFNVDEQELFIGASIGISLFPSDARSVEQVMRNADSALFKAKSSGRATYAFYSQELTSLARQRVELGAQLHQALEKDELRVFYQPIYGLNTGKLLGVEALVRWQHPERGLVPPDQFIPIAEESDLIGSIDAWVLAQACQQMATWQRQGLNLEFMSVNVSSRIFSHGKLDGLVTEVLTATGLDAALLELEITESAVMEDADAALQLMQRLRALGVRLAIDDFGTGYSSLARLKRMPVHKLKLDQSFVRGLPADHDDAAITRAVIALGHSLGMQVQAEGIEDASQAAFLQGLGCELGQGYLYGKPQPAELLQP
ncbi:phosphodiesterase DibA [Pseudomonas turukhanskensis]|uniref:cyclic-guanylate-specific phosphodiesterase n=1 Tax=Pseudomonas turukhanskensis TaxID=1806536 RepID=A0A9W6KB75_9PSED|nr:EAL domain-containing protein [Pseudomonas turukhanskensis]GLK92162.1 GGDEF domain-containing protein [Pseudomonas turukhanskensis]